jgi:hypothetical protein
MPRGAMPDERRGGRAKGTPRSSEASPNSRGRSSRPGLGKAASGPRRAASALGGRSSFPLISAVRRSSGWMLAMPLLMSPVHSGWTGRPCIECARRRPSSPPRADPPGRPAGQHHGAAHHGLADPDRPGVGFRSAHAAAHVGIERKIAGADQHLAVGRLRHRALRHLPLHRRLSSRIRYLTP